MDPIEAKGVGNTVTKQFPIRMKVVKKWYCFEGNCFRKETEWNDERRWGAGRAARSGPFWFFYSIYKAYECNTWCSFM